MAVIAHHSSIAGIRRSRGRYDHPLSSAGTCLTGSDRAPRSASDQPSTAPLPMTGLSPATRAGTPVLLGANNLGMASIVNVVDVAVADSGRTIAHLRDSDGNQARFVIA